MEKVSDFLAGMVVALGMRTVLTPPKVSNPSERGVTSTSKMSDTLSSPPRTPPCIAAPIATTSSGFTERLVLC